MSVLSYFIVDNRQLSHRSFNSESSHASFHRYVRNTIGKFCALNAQHHWIERPSAIIAAQSPDKGKLFGKYQCDLGQLATILEPTYSCVGGVAIPRLTWSSYIIDALQKVGHLIQQNKTDGQPTKKKHIVVIFSTDLCLIGDQFSQTIDDALEKFCQTCKELTEKSSFDIRIVCTMISDTTNSTQFDNQNLLAIHSRLKSLEHFVTFQLMPNSAMHFEEELRVITAAQQIPLLSKIQFPIVQNVDCSVVIELSASTLSGADCLHQGLAAPELCSLVSRSDLDPLFIEGHSCLAKTPSYECSKHILPSKPSHHQNKLIFGGLARMLASRDILLVLRVVSAVTSCDEYWALVPPAAAPVARSVPYQTDSQSQLLQGLHIEEGALASHVVEMNTTCGTSLRGGEAEDCHMVLVRLVDRDELLMDGSLNATKDTTSHAHTRNRKHKADRSLEDSATGGTISSQVSLNEGGSDEGDGGAEAVDEEEDAAVMAETEEYLAQSLLESMGAPTRYNPLACPSGRINAVYDEQLRIKSGRHQPSGGSTAIPSQQYYPNLHQAAPQQVQSNYSAYQPAPAPITPAAYPLYQSPAYPPHHQQHQSAPQHQAQPLASYHPQNDFRGGCNPPQPQQQQQQQYAMPGYQQAQLQLVEQPKKPRKKAENTNTFQQHQQQQDAQSNQSCVPSYQKQQHNPTSGEEHYQQRAGYSNGGAPDKPLTGKGSRGGRGAYAGRRGGAGRGGSNGREEGGRGRAVNSDSDGVSVRVVPASRSLPGAANTNSRQTNEFEVAPISSLAPMQRKAAVLTDSGGPDEEDDDESIWEAAIRKKGPTASRTTAGFTSHSRDSAAAPPARLLKRKFFAPAPSVAGRVTVAEDWTGEDDISFTGGGF